MAQDRRTMRCTKRAPQKKKYGSYEIFFFLLLLITQGWQYLPLTCNNKSQFGWSNNNNKNPSTTALITKLLYFGCATVKPIKAEYLSWRSWKAEWQIYRLGPSGGVTSPVAIALPKVIAENSYYVSKVDGDRGGRLHQAQRSLTSSGCFYRGFPPLTADHSKFVVPWGNTMLFLDDTEVWWIHQPYHLISLNPDKKIISYS